ncbi:unnamed protein product [Moneuplotes crassus]|uniref:Uncharacterized protein n=1 Tax=Euplotes crassus TaxID=5936 RepID=A0AAD1XCM3_EUPCR|nr:unnamed protein product [Moneuplotes crassus]
MTGKYAAQHSPKITSPKKSKSKSKTIWPASGEGRYLQRRHKKDAFLFQKSPKKSSKANISIQKSFNISYASRMKSKTQRGVKPCDTIFLPKKPIEPVEFPKLKEQDQGQDQILKTHSSQKLFPTLCSSFTKKSFTSHEVKEDKEFIKKFVNKQNKINKIMSKTYKNMRNDFEIDQKKAIVQAQRCSREICDEENWKTLEPNYIVNIETK